MKIFNFKFNTSFVSPEMPKVRANKTSFNIMTVHFYIRIKLNIRYTIFQYCLEPVIIMRILIGLEAILANLFLSELKSNYAT